MKAITPTALAALVVGAALALTGCASGSVNGGTAETPAEPEEGSTPNSAERQAALDDARDAMTARDAALKAGDLEAFAAEDKKLTEAVQKLLDLEEAAGE